MDIIILAGLVLVGLLVLIPLACWLVGMRYLPHTRVGIIEKLWSGKGSLSEGRIIATDSEAGFQAELLRGGLHWGYFPWQYRIHPVPLVIVSQGKMGYIYARDGEPLPPTQTLGLSPECNSFQDAAAFLQNRGQRGRQRLILREGVYAINTALFVVITEDTTHTGPTRPEERAQFLQWQGQLRAVGGFSPVIVGFGGNQPVDEDGYRQEKSPPSGPPPLPAPAAPSRRMRDESGGVTETTFAPASPPPPPVPDNSRLPSSRRINVPGGDLLPTDCLGVVSVQDGPPLPSGEIIAPEVTPRDGIEHNNFQDPEKFLALGGRRGKQLQVLTDGTYFINRWFATVEIKPKTLIPIGYVGVVVSYYGTEGTDVSGQGFRYGEQVSPGQRGVWTRALAPGKYALNPYALRVELVPTVNFVLRWVTGEVEDHKYDEDLTSISIITADAYEPNLPLSLVLHIDYEKASRVIQRFGDVKRLISQTLDPILTAYFRDVAQSSNMLDLLTHREDIQRRATEELSRRFQNYDINCVAVLIGRPEAVVRPGKEDPIDRLFDQLRQRRLADEQRETFACQEEAANRLRELNKAQAAANKQAELTQTLIDVEIAGNKGAAVLAEAERLAKRDIVRADAEAQAREFQGKGKASEITQTGYAEAGRIAQIGAAEAEVFQRKIAAYGDPRLFALNLVTENLAKSQQPLVPERMIVTGGGGGSETGSGSASHLLLSLLQLLLAEKTGSGFNDPRPPAPDA